MTKMTIQEAEIEVRGSFVSILTLVLPRLATKVFRLKQLEVESGAGEEVLKAAYKRLAMKW